MRTWDMMIAVSTIEDSCLKLRKLTCDGSMLQGHTVNEAKAEANWLAIQAELKRIQASYERAVAESQLV